MAVGLNPVSESPGTGLNIVEGYFAFMDIALAAIPVSVIWKLQMPRDKRISLSLILSVGIL